LKNPKDLMWVCIVNGPSSGKKEDNVYSLEQT